MRNFLVGTCSDKIISCGEESCEGLPEHFTNPFSYKPHPLCIKAADCVRRAIASDSSLHDFLKGEGKMFGVLVAVSAEGELGYLAAHSGVLESSSLKGFFVPPVYDLLSPDSFFPEGEAEINALNDEVSALENDTAFLEYVRESGEIKEAHLQKIAELKEIYRRGKAGRDKLRNLLAQKLDAKDGNVELECESRLQAIERESQFQKGEIRRAENRMKGELLERSRVEQQRYALIEEKKQLRKQKSVELQRRIFEHFSFLNASGERKNLLEIFGDVIPPAGAGECAAPRLLQYAYLNGYRPVAMGEFWYGGSNSSELRRDGNFYPSCKGKCGPILGFMLQGLDVDSTSYHSTYGSGDSHNTPVPEILYEDEYIVAVNKPSGVLSVPGREGSEMELGRMMEDLSGRGIPVHRLDMHTSGVLLLAKDMDIYRELQRQFQGREVGKVYYAVLEGEISPRSTGDCVVWRSGVSGEISIPLAPDYINRPLQMADFLSGKPAVTRFEVVGIKDGRSYLKFSPVTGRTHQLRVHSAHPRGLDAPIVGDILYGNGASRMMLHAGSVQFIHPRKGLMEIVAPHPDDFIWLVH